MIALKFVATTLFVNPHFHDIEILTHTPGLKSRATTSTEPNGSACFDLAISHAMERLEPSGSGHFVAT
jgi:hypothetical protein